MLLSGRGEQGAQHPEQLVIDSGARWTLVRCAFFSQTFSEGAWVDAIAEVVATVLTEDRHVVQLYELFTEILDGHNAHLTDGVRRVLGRDPRDFGDYLRRIARTGVWDG